MTTAATSLASLTNAPPTLPAAVRRFAKRLDGHCSDEFFERAAAHLGTGLAFVQIVHGPAPDGEVNATVMLEYLDDCDAEIQESVVVLHEMYPGIVQSPPVSLENFRDLLFVLRRALFAMVRDEKADAATAARLPRGALS